jgi:hypothetical protein
VSILVRRRLGLVATVLTMFALMAGCATQPAEGRLAEFRVEGERLLADLTGLAGLPPTETGIDLHLDDPAPLDRSRQAASLTAFASLPADDPTVVDAVTEAVRAHLTDLGWQAEIVPDPEDGRSSAAFFSHDPDDLATDTERWSVEVVPTVDVPGVADALHVLVHSPLTVRGSFTDETRSERF